MCIKKFFLSLLHKKSSLRKPTPEKIVEETMSQKDIITLQHKNAVEFGKFSFELEEKRGERLILHSGHMLTAFSLYSAALLTLLGTLLNNDIISRTHLFIASTCIAVPLVLSLTFTMLAQWRFKYNTLKDAEEFRLAFYGDSLNYREQYQFDYQFIMQLHDVQSSKTTANNKRLFCVRAAMVCFFLSLTMLITAYTILSILYTKGV